MAQGFAFGTGSAVARTAVDSVMGVFSGSSTSSAPAPVAPQAPTYHEPSAQVPAACRFDFQNFQDCLKTNSSNVAECDFYLNSLKSCQQSNM